MSIEAMNWALEQRTGSASAKSVLLILANRANHEGQCWPGIDGIAEQTELSRRAVIQQIKNLIDRKLISVKHRGGTGEGRQSNVYLLHIGGLSAGDAQRGNVHEVHGLSANGVGQCARGAPESKDKPKRNPKKQKRAPRDFRLDDDLKAFARSHGMTDAVITDEFAQLMDHEYKDPRSDWPAAWRTWVRNWKKWRPKQEADAESRVVMLDD